MLNQITKVLPAIRVENKPSRVISIIEELKLGKFVILDSVNESTHVSPLQWYVRLYLNSKNSADLRRVEVRTNHDVLSYSMDDRGSFINPFPHPGQAGFEQQDVNEKLKLHAPIFEQRLGIAMGGDKIVAIPLDAYYFKEAVSMNDAMLNVLTVILSQLSTLTGSTKPTIVVELNELSECPEVEKILHDLNNLGCGILVLRLVGKDTGLTDMAGDFVFVDRDALNLVSASANPWSNTVKLRTNETVRIRMS